MLQVDVKKHIENTIIKAKAAGFPDGLYFIYRHNQLVTHKNIPETAIIDPTTVFTEQSPETVLEWSKRAARLHYNHASVASAQIECADAHKTGDQKAIKKAEKNYELIFKKYITDNPGFSTQIYELAIFAGIGKALH
jgi:hypothetical protein